MLPIHIYGDYLNTLLLLVVYLIGEEMAFRICGSIESGQENEIQSIAFVSMAGFRAQELSKQR